MKLVFSPMGSREGESSARNEGGGLKCLGLISFVLIIHKESLLVLLGN